MNMHRQRKRGFALPAAVGGLVIIGVLVTAGFYMSRQELRIGVASQFGPMAVNLAQSGTNQVIITQSSQLSGMSIWDTTTFNGTMDEGTWSVAVTKLSTRLFYMDATATVTEGGAMWGGATRRLGLVTRLTSANIDPPAALTTQGSLRVGGSSQIEGHDDIPSGWSGVCDAAALGDMPGILIDDVTNISTSGTRYTVDGDPAISQDTTITVDELLSFGDMTWADLVALADIRIPPGASITQVAPDSTLVGGSYICNTARDDNWGDPLNAGSACWSHFPILYATGDVGIQSNASGQGIMLVEGDLKLQGGFTFYGPVIVKGELSTAGTGGHFNGGVIAANVNLGSSTVLGNAVVNYSSCAVERAILNNSALTQVRPLAMRSWVDLTNVVN